MCSLFTLLSSSINEAFAIFVTTINKDLYKILVPFVSFQNSEHQVEQLAKYVTQESEKNLLLLLFFVYRYPTVKSSIPEFPGDSPFELTNQETDIPASPGSITKSCVTIHRR